jgi:hypothetical protein
MPVLAYARVAIPQVSVFSASRMLVVIHQPVPVLRAITYPKMPVNPVTLYVLAAVHQALVTPVLKTLPNHHQILSNAHVMKAIIRWVASVYLRILYVLAILMIKAASLVKKMQVVILMTVPVVQDIMNPQAAVYLAVLFVWTVVQHWDVRAAWRMLAILATVSVRQDITSQALRVFSVLVCVNHAIVKDVPSV